MPYKEDLAAMIADIERLKALVDTVIVSIHWGLHIIPRVIPMYCFDVGHAAVDAGADLILGTHPHILKGIEMYKGKTIFYSTGNFACEIGPAQREKTGGEFALKLVEQYGCVPDPECPTYNLSRESRVTLIAKAIIRNGEIVQVSYIPCFVNRNSEPEIVTPDTPLGQEVYRYVEEISASEHLPVRFSWNGNEVLITPN
jgi:poly-gamma-glutamate synthesis protein (capsule biosynthesis protein)